MSNYQHLTFSVDNSIGHLTLNRPNKKNAINDALCLEIEQVFINMPKDVSVILFSGNGPEFCSGLDLSEHTAREPFEVVVHSRMWHRVFSHISNSGIPIVAALHGAVIGGGLELAICAHVRVSDETTFYRLPEGRHGIFVGGGASVRVAQTIGHGRMTEMMLTGRTLNAADGERLGLAHYVVPKGTAMEKAQELAETIATNSRLSNWAMASGITQTSGEVKERIDAFLNRKKSS